MFHAAAVGSAHLHEELWRGNCNSSDMKRVLIILAAAAAISVLSALAQELIVDVNLTILTVLVEDERGRPVLNLTAGDFEVVHDGNVTPVKHLSLEAEPLAIGLVVDRSASIAAVKKQMDEAVGLVLDSSSSDDLIFLMTFAGERKLNVPLTTNHKTIRDAMRKAKMRLGTRFYDVLFDSLGYLSQSARERKALLVFTDGADHYSLHTFEQALDRAAFHNYPIYIFGYIGDDSRTGSTAGRREIRSEFEQLAAVTNGRVLFCSQAADCAGDASDIVNALVYSYKLGFYNSESFPQSSEVQIRVRGEPSRRLKVRVARPAMPVRGV
jgi:VWFA-related protein